MQCKLSETLDTETILFMLIFRLIRIPPTYVVKKKLNISNTLKFHLLSLIY